ncbi:cytochrome b, partial [Shewanella algae]|uniref:cytochrome b n=1 Tax=Shewanella algae TaxID=38313 RepID=UPI00313C2F79
APFMSIKNTNSRWGWIAQGFHWPIALLIFAAWATFELHDNAPKHSQQSSYWLGIHKSLGISVFFLVWLRLIWRFVNKAPADIGLAP